jgi:hypothetical protein
MLRSWVIGLGVAVLVLTLVLWAGGHRVGALAPLMVWAAILVGGVVFERAAYKPELSHPPGAGWVRTEEKSVDAQGLVTVWFNQATGERAYVRSRAGGPD